MTIQQLYELFILEQQYRNNTDITIDWYKTQLQEFFRWLDSDDTEGLSLLHFKEYGVYLRSLRKRDGSKLSSSSVQGSLRAVKAFYNFCIEQEYIEDFSRHLKLPRIYKKEKLILEDEEIRALMSCGSNCRFELRNKCFITLMLDSGLRRGEIPRINIADVNLHNHTLLVRGKGGKQRIVPLGSTSAKLLEKHIKSRGSCSSSEPLFIDMYGKRCTDNLMKQVFQDLKQASGI
ncbi:MAG: hypothetical protein E7485_09270 [Ruminococcaceae bacterium]|nr:hypothetical protein [Oscillospiraceae bacterium]